jgi:hypothetical protein
MVAKLHEFLVCTFNGTKFLKSHDDHFVYNKKGRAEKRIFGKQILICATVKSGAGSQTENRGANFTISN